MQYFTECNMLSDMAAVIVAIDLCNRPELKKEILCTSGSYYDINKGDWLGYGDKRKWNEIVEKETTVILDNFCVAKQLHEKVMGLVFLVGMRMLTWAEYHEGTLGLSREYSVRFLNNSFFTQQGIIDNKKAAVELMKDESLNIKQKYKLACLYCFTEHIPVLYRDMAKEEFYDAKSPRKIQQPVLVKLWSYYLMGEIDQLKGERNLDQYRLEKAVESGSIAAVAYCLEKTKLSRKKNAVEVAALEAIRCRIRAGRPHTEGDWVVFQNLRYKNSEVSWVPSDYYVDILCFLLSKMEEDQQVNFLKTDTEGSNYKRASYENQRRSRVLGYFLNWPYQDYFMKTARLMWEFLPERDYAVLLLRICDKINPRRETHLKYGEERSYDYRELLKTFWCQSPERYRRYVFTNQEVKCLTVLTTKSGVGLLINLLTLKNFAYGDRENIKLILASATDNEKEHIFASREWKIFCIGQMEEEKWKILELFVRNCFLSKEEENKFKRKLSFTKEAKRVCIDFIKHDKWNAAESFIKWSSLSEEEIKQLKKEMIYSEDGMRACAHLVVHHGKNLIAVDQFIRWCFSSEEEVKAFKKELIFSDQGTGACATLVERDQQELAGEFINFCLSSKGEVRELKKKTAYRFGRSVCEDLISFSKGEEIYDNRGEVVGERRHFKGGKWEEVEKFVTWCFSSEEEICDFKKNELLKVSGEEIHVKLIKLNQWEEAETFFAWLGLSADEIKKLKKETLYDEASEMFSELMHSKEGDERFIDYGSREEAVELLLRWFLTDKETVLEFKEYFKGSYRGKEAEEYKDILGHFDLAIEQRLGDISEEKMGVKRKSETSSPSKRLCNLKLENISKK